MSARPELKVKFLSKCGLFVSRFSKKKALVPVPSPCISCKIGCRDRFMYSGSQLIQGPGTRTWSPVLKINWMGGTSPDLANVSLIGWMDGLY